MRGSYFILVGLAFLMGGCISSDRDTTLPSPTVNESVQSCYNNPSLCNTTDLCMKATVNKQWDKRSEYLPYVREAHRQGLNCNVGETPGVQNSKSSFSNQPNEIIGAVKSGIKRLLQLGIISSREQSKLEETIKIMPLAEFSKLQTTCASAFTEIQPQKCDEVLKSLMR